MILFFSVLNNSLYFKIWDSDYLPLVVVAVDTSTLESPAY